MVGTAHSPGPHLVAAQDDKRHLQLLLDLNQGGWVILVVLPALAEDHAALVLTLVFG
jgi:hypothetical protein